ncbi:Oidioi.mRNA.OKI2018_I69.PAR.g9434.t1.cds [Oikopleura dioica]|uniref:Oidioi.mRNA.OKI2018_I69.PAR.g9434.t1.cds n=1 Tax=Oikopleura dioica TaxID=34765 RepID=A0ABN7RP57_OIKDI|nr:Oidioi.mRNA.OKI2018_I69.PAR.g9434.t1.cds [Oikopleura dioica]
MSSSGMKTFSLPEGLDLFYVNDRGEQVINPAAMPYLQSVQKPPVYPVINKIENQEPESKKRKIDEISQAEFIEGMKQEAPDEDEENVICIDSDNSSSTSGRSSRLTSSFSIPSSSAVVQKENQAPGSSSGLQEVPFDLVKMLEEIRNRSPTKTLPPLIVPEYAHFKVKVQNMAVRGETNSVSADGKAQKKTGKWKKIERSQLQEVDLQTIDWSEWTQMSFDPDGGTIDGCFGRFSVKPDNTVDRWKKDLEKKKTKLLKMVANTTIAAEGFKKITVKFLCEHKEPEVHRFEYEQGMLFLTIPKWIQKKLRHLKKKIDFNKQPLVKLSRKSQIADALERSVLGNLACALLMENFWIFDKIPNTKFEKQLNELYQRFYTEPKPCLPIDQVPKGHPVLNHLLIERVSNSTQQSILFQVSNRQMCIQRLCGSTLNLPYEKL